MDLAEIDEEGRGLLFFGDTMVNKCVKIDGQPNVFLLETSVHLEREAQKEPKAGQFYLIRAKKTAVNYNRPISVYHSETTRNADGSKDVVVQFLMLKKGRGTGELCELKAGDAMTVIGPLGTPWTEPDADALSEKKICIIGTHPYRLISSSKPHHIGLIQGRCRGAERVVPLYLSHSHHTGLQPEDWKRIKKMI